MKNINKSKRDIKSQNKSKRNERERKKESNTMIKKIENKKNFD